MTLIDAHCHLEAKDFPDVESVVARARAAGVEQAVLVGLLQRPGDFGQALELVRRFPGFFFPTAGIHPHDAAQATDADWAELERRCRLPAVVGVGEAGLDYYYDHSPRDVQAQSLRRHCELARAVEKPLVVHVRDAHGECADILQASGVRRGQIHCFTGDTAAARVYLDLGFHLSISGVITYKKTEALQEAVRYAPLDRLLVETDSPYLAPIPLRGKKNEPAHVVHTARRVAELKGLSLEDVSAACTANTRALFGLPPPAWGPHAGPTLGGGQGRP